MSDQMTDLLERRRSVLAANLTEPGPSEAEIDWLLRCAARVPDHGRLVPWRFVLLRGPARLAFGEAMERIAAAREELSDNRRQIERERFGRAPLVVCVISRAAPHPKIPEWEQELSAGAVCFNLLVGASILGYAAQWLTEWCAYDEEAHRILGMAEHEKVAGFVYMGTAQEPPSERPRPDMAEIVSDWSPTLAGAEEIA